ncbi:MAG TPA: hypothetical protein VHO69_12905 [Phototrophicaceae bacterium]|nr:hypothetical protein [Phototrophicaceae bacterium]
MRNADLERAKSALRRLLQHEKDAQKRYDIENIIESINRGIYTYEQAIRAAKMIGLRNPSFDGDEVGYPDDDFK